MGREGQRRQPRVSIHTNIERVRMNRDAWTPNLQRCLSSLKLAAENDYYKLGYFQKPDKVFGDRTIEICLNDERTNIWSNKGLARSFLNDSGQLLNALNSPRPGNEDPIYGFFLPIERILEGDAKSSLKLVFDNPVVARSVLMNKNVSHNFSMKEMKVRLVPKKAPESKMTVLEYLLVNYFGSDKDYEKHEAFVRDVVSRSKSVQEFVNISTFKEKEMEKAEGKIRNGKIADPIELARIKREVEEVAAGKERLLAVLREQLYNNRPLRDATYENMAFILNTILRTAGGPHFDVGVFSFGIERAEVALKHKHSNNNLEWYINEHGA